MTLPNFLIIGAPKAGTTSLYHYLQEHPQIYMSPVKEPYFFVLEDEQIDFQGPADSKKDYVTDLETYCALFKGVSNEVAIGEASPGYLYSPKALERIHHYLPDARLIAILRDPVERAYSNFFNLVRQDIEPLTDFVQAMSLEEKRISNNWSFRWHYKQRGFYYTQLRRYFDLFDRDQIKVYLYEDFRTNSINVLQDIFKFLEVDDTFVPDISHKHNVSRVTRNKALHRFMLQSNPMKSMLKYFLPFSLRQDVRAKLLQLNYRNKPPLLPEVRKQFIEEYREDILRLQELIQRDLSKWLEV